MNLNTNKDEPVKIQVSELSPFLAAIASGNEHPRWEINVSKAPSKVSSRDETCSVPVPSGVVVTSFQQQSHDLVAEQLLPLEFEAVGQWPETWWVPQSSFEDSWIADWIAGQNSHMTSCWPWHWENERQTDLASQLVLSSPPPVLPPSPCSQTLPSSPPSFSKLPSDCASVESSTESTNAEETVSGNTSEDDGYSDESESSANILGKTSQEPESKEATTDDWSTFGTESMECWDYDFMVRELIMIPPPGLWTPDDDDDPFASRLSPRQITPPPGLYSPRTTGSDADVSETDASPCSSAIKQETVVIPLHLSSYRKGGNSRQQRTPGCTKKKNVRSEPLQSRTHMQVGTVASSPKQMMAGEVSATKSSTSSWSYVLLAVGLLIVAVVAILVVSSRRLEEERAYEALLDNMFPSIAVAPAESLDIEFAMGRADKVSFMKSKMRVLSKSILSVVIKGWA